MMKKQKSKSDLTFFQKVKRHKTLLLMCTPAVLFFFAFNYVPLPGIYVAFVKFNYRKGIFTISKWQFCIFLLIQV